MADIEIWGPDVTHITTPAAADRLVLGTGPGAGGYSERSEFFYRDASGNFNASGRANILGASVGGGVVQPLLELKSASDSVSNSVEMLLTARVSGQSRTAIGGRREGSGATAQVYIATDDKDRLVVGGDGIVELVGEAVGNNVVQPLGRLRSLSDAISNAVEWLFTPLVSGQSRTAIGARREGATANAQIYLATNNTDRVVITGAGHFVFVGGLTNAANDAAASAAGIEVGGLYRNGSVVMIRVA